MGGLGVRGGYLPSMDNLQNIAIFEVHYDQWFVHFVRSRNGLKTSMYAKIFWLGVVFSSVVLMDYYHWSSFFWRGEVLVGL